MARPRKVPAVLVEATVRRNAKLASLSSDTARLGYFYVVLGDAKVSEPVPGQFASREVFRDVAGRWARFLEEYLKTGLLEVAPRLCDRCKAAWSSMPPRSGVLVVHDWHQHQYDPRKIERQREYEERQRADREASVSDGVSDAHSDGVSDANPTVISRASARGGGRRRASNVERRTENESGSPDVDRPALDGREPTLSQREHDAWRSFGPEWDGLKAAWLARGLRLPPAGEPSEGDGTSQRDVLWQIVDHRPTDVVRWIGEAPGKTSHDIVRHVLARWHEVRVEAGADDDLAAWSDRPTKGEAAEALGEIVGRMR